MIISNFSWRAKHRKRAYIYMYCMSILRLNFNYILLEKKYNKSSGFYVFTGICCFLGHFTSKKDAKFLPLQQAQFCLCCRKICKPPQEKTFLVTITQTKNVAYCDPPVTVLTTCLTMLGGFISSLRMLGSVARGKPLSSISSSN